MKISIAICTRNRADSLLSTLASIEESLRLVLCEVEIVVVDNGSTDRTAAYLGDLRSKLPLVCTFEGTPGLSRARNRALAVASGEYVVWTDDDVIVARDWLSAYADAFSRHPDCVVFGGPIQPKFEPDPPEWLRLGWKAVPDAYGNRDLGNEEFMLVANSPRIPYGANFAVRAEEQRCNLFDETLGAGSRQGLLGEETAIIRQILRSGHKGVWVPAASIVHVVPAERQTLSHLQRYYEAAGKTEMSMELMGVEAKRWVTVLGAPRWLWRRRAAAEAKRFVARFTGDPLRTLATLAEASRCRGMMLQYRSTFHAEPTTRRVSQ